VEIGRSLSLSDRELQVAQGVFDDCTERALADKLGISPHTVHTHIERLHRKLGVTNRVQLILHVTAEFLMLTLAGQEPLLPICAWRAAGTCPFALR